MCRSIRRTLPQFSWKGIGSAALMLTLAGGGMSSIISSVRAQEAASAAPKPAPLRVIVGTSPLRLQGSISSAPIALVVGQQDVVLQPPPTLQTPSVEPQDKDSQSSDDQRQLRSQLRDLMKQRADLDSRIEDLQRRLGKSDSFFNDYGATRQFRAGNNSYWVTPFADSSRKMTPEERKQAEEAVKRAQEAMRAAQKAMEKAQKAMGDNATIYRNYLPQIQEHLRALEVPNTVPALPDVHVYGWSQDDQKKFEQNWTKQQPEFERAMRDFQARMQKWADEFEARMRREFGTKNGDTLAPPPDKPKDTKPEKDTPDKDQDSGSDIL